jgi:hypothetical protein
MKTQFYTDTYIDYYALRHFAPRHYEDPQRVEESDHQT